MPKIAYCGFISFALIAGFVGGTLANSLLGSLLAFAQHDTTAPATIVAQRISLVDKQGKPRLHLFISSHDQPTLVFTDSNDRPRVGLTLRSDGAPSLNLIGPGGRSHAVLSPHTLAFKDPGHQPRTVSTRLLGQAGLDANELVFLPSPTETFSIDSGTISSMLYELEAGSLTD